MSIKYHTMLWTNKESISRFTVPERFIKTTCRETQTPLNTYLLGWKMFDANRASVLVKGLKSCSSLQPEVKTIILKEEV